MEDDEFEIKLPYPTLNAIFDDIEQQVLAPLSCLREVGSEWILEFDLPMVDKKDISISFDGENTVTVEAKLKETYCETSSETKKEFNFFKKSVTLPGKIDESKISAKFEQGRLRIRIPKLHADKKISIE